MKVNLSGTVSYSPNYGNQSLEVPLKTASYNNKTLISLLNASAYASNIIFSVTSSNQIPAGSSFLFDPDAGTLALTNNSGFYFPLTGPGYSFGFLEIDESQLIGTYSLSATLAGSETDKTGFYFELKMALIVPLKSFSMAPPPSLGNMARPMAPCRTPA